MKWILLILCGTQAFIKRFEAEFASSNCQELLDCDMGTPEGQERFKKENLNERCKVYTLRAAELEATIIEEHQDGINR